MEKEYLSSLVEQGLSTREISNILKKSQTTTRYRLAKFGLKTKNKSFSDGYVSNKITESILNSSNIKYCTCCDVELCNENTYTKSDGKIYSFMCKSCHAYKTLTKRLNFKNKCIEYKGGSCNICGYKKDISALDFHHINPNEKEIDPSRMMHKKWSFIKNELDKCILLCSNCHREEHNKIEEYNKLQKSFNINNVSSLSSVILTGKNTKLPACSICDKIFGEVEETKGRRGVCKPCDSKYVMNKMTNSKQRTVEYMGGCCSICKYDKCIRALEFHHVDPTKKSPTYNKRFRCWGFERQKKELENCILVCSNCHREIHSKDEWKSQDSENIP